MEEWGLAADQGEGTFDRAQREICENFQVDAKGGNISQKYRCNRFK